MLPVSIPRQSEPVANSPRKRQVKISYCPECAGRDGSRNGSLSGHKTQLSDRSHRTYTRSNTTVPRHLRMWSSYFPNAGSVGIPQARDPTDRSSVPNHWATEAARWLESTVHNDPLIDGPYPYLHNHWYCTTSLNGTNRKSGVENLFCTH